MATQGKIEREKNIKKLQEKYHNLREELKKIRDNISLSMNERIQAHFKLDALPKNTSKVRSRNRCSISGNPRAYSRTFGISRWLLRELVSQGKIPGVHHATW